MIEAASAFTWAIVLALLGVASAVALHFVYEITVASVVVFGFAGGQWGGRVALPFLVDRGWFPLIRRRGK